MPAPSASRSANSRRRASARPSCRLATFTQPMISTSVTAPISAVSIVRRVAKPWSAIT